MSAETKDKEYYDQQVKAVLGAWSHFYPDPERNWPGDLGARAALRRAGSPLDMMLLPEFHAFFFRLRARDFKVDYLNKEEDYLPLALLLAALVERRTENISGPTLMAALGGNGDADSAPMKPLRFRTLMAAMEDGPTPQALTALRRAMKLVRDTNINIYALCRDLLWWQDQTRIRWSFQYFGQDRTFDNRS